MNHDNPLSEHIERGRIDTDNKSVIIGVYRMLAERGIRDGWYQELQNKNFERARTFISKLGTDNRSTVIDIGCGTGAFFNVWREICSGQYVGVDLLDEFDPIISDLVRATGGQMIVGDFESTNLQTANFVVASGVLSIGLPKDKYAFLRRNLERMIGLGTTGIYFNYWEEGFDDGAFRPFIDYDSSEVDTLLSLLVNNSNLKTVERNPEPVFDNGVLLNQQHVYIY